MKLLSWRKMTGLDDFSTSGIGREDPACLMYPCLFHQSLPCELFQGKNEITSHRSLLMVILLTISLSFHYLEIRCLKPDLKNGRITHGNKCDFADSCDYFYGDKISYLCYDGSTYEAICKGDGIWIPETPTCDNSKSL